MAVMVAKAVLAAQAVLAALVGKVVRVVPVEQVLWQERERQSFQLPMPSNLLELEAKAVMEERAAMEELVAMAVRDDKPEKVVMVYRVAVMVLVWLAGAVLVDLVVQAEMVVQAATVGLVVPVGLVALVVQALSCYPR